MVVVSLLVQILQLALHEPNDQCITYLFGFGICNVCTRIQSGAHQMRNGIFKQRNKKTNENGCLASTQIPGVIGQRKTWFGEKRKREKKKKTTHCLISNIQGENVHLFQLNYYFQEDTICELKSQWGERDFSKVSQPFNQIQHTKANSFCVPYRNIFENWKLNSYTET